MLEISHVCKRFGGVAAAVLQDVNLEIADGEFYSLLGPSGCGKTTLLRAIAGFERLDAGDIRLQGRSLTTAPPHRRPFNMVFQRYALFPHLDVLANVTFGLRMHGVNRAEARRRAEEALALVSLDGFAARRIQTLSGGQQQRVALARAIVNRPRVLLLDEPLSALDLKLRQRMQSELRALQRRLGMTFLFVTHAQDEALALSDRVAVMNGGRVEQVGAPAALYERPATPFVATFVGSVNQLGRGGQRYFIRPERVQWSRTRPATAALVVPGVVQQVIYKGATVDVEVGVAAEPGKAPLSTPSTWTLTLMAGAETPAAGTAVFLHCDAAAAALITAEATS